MSALKIKRFPSKSQIMTAFHQDEGISLTGENDKEYLFVPAAMGGEKGQTVLGGTCWEIQGKQYKNERQATLTQIEGEKTATLSFTNLNW